MNKDDRMASFLTSLEAASKYCGIEIRCISGVVIHENREAITDIRYDYDGGDLDVWLVSYKNSTGE